MSEETQPTITPEQIAAYQQQQQAAELKAQEACVSELVRVADSHGYMIVAMPVQVADGRIGVIATAAQWGLQRKA